MNHQLVNELNQHTPTIFSNPIPPNGPHIAMNCQSGGGNIISDYNNNMNSMDVEVPNIPMVGGGGGMIDANYTGGELDKMKNYIVQTGGRIHKDQSISEAFFDLLKKRKLLAVKRKSELQKGFVTLLRARKKMYTQRKAKLSKSLGNVYARSPMTRLIGRDMQQQRSNRIVLKSNTSKAIGRSIGKSIGRSVAIAGGSRKCSASCKNKSHKHKKRVHFAAQHGGVGYSANGINLPSNLSMLASPASFTPYPQCTGAPYQHYV